VALESSWLIAVAGLAARPAASTALCRRGSCFVSVCCVTSLRRVATASISLHGHANAQNGEHKHTALLTANARHVPSSVWCAYGLELPSAMLPWASLPLRTYCVCTETIRCNTLSCDQAMRRKGAVEGCMHMHALRHATVAASQAAPYPAAHPNQASRHGYLTLGVALDFLPVKTACAPNRCHTTYCRAAKLCIIAAKAHVQAVVCARTQHTGSCYASSNSFHVRQLAAHPMRQAGMASRAFHALSL
jgi:hypothetical protein